MSWFKTILLTLFLSFVWAATCVYGGVSGWFLKPIAETGNTEQFIANSQALIANNHANIAYVLIENGQVAKMICSYPRTANSLVFPELYRSGKIELELVPQGTLAERIRSAGAGIPAFFTPTSVGTPLAEGKEARTFDGVEYVMEHAIKADFALIKAKQADRYGNLTFNKTARNFAPIMAMAATQTLVQTNEMVELGDIDPENVITPGIFVNRIIEVKKPQQESKLVKAGVVYP